MTFLKELHKPDILDCIAHLSSDEVFTPPKLVNEMLNLLPPELFTSPDTKFLEPGCKSGVFLREIAKRLIEGLKEQIPDLQQRIEHIFTKQLYGIAITELTGLLARRSVYCSKSANGEYSICKFTTPDGNIEYARTKHIWENGKCILCGASQSQYDRGDILETHAYSFIHCNEEQNTAQWKRLKDMKFDVIIGNPPYQLSCGGGGKGSGSAIPIYQYFVQQAIKLNPRYLTMIIPARWYSGGRNLDIFRNEMLNSSQLVKLIDFSDSKDCFPGVDIAGGICYFLWERDKKDPTCEVENHFSTQIISEKRTLNKYDIFIRNNRAVDIVDKVMSFNEKMMNSIVSPVSLFGLNTNFKVDKTGDLKVRYSGGIGLCWRKDVNDSPIIDLYKTIISAASYDHGGQTDKNGKRRILSIVECLPPKTVCTSTYIVVNSFKTIKEAENLKETMKTFLVRFLVSQVCISQHISRDSFKFVPNQDFTQEWTDEKLYKKYGLTKEEIEFIESMIKPME